MEPPPCICIQLDFGKNGVTLFVYDIHLGSNLQKQIHFQAELNTAIFHTFFNGLHLDRQTGMRDLNKCGRQVMHRQVLSHSVSKERDRSLCGGGNGVCVCMRH